MYKQRLLLNEIKKKYNLKGKSSKYRVYSTTITKTYVFMLKSSHFDQQWEDERAK